MKSAKEWKIVYILTYRGVYSEGFDEIDCGATARSLPDFMASMHLRFAARLTAWTKARCRNASKLLWSVIWCRELIVERMGLFESGYILDVELSLYTNRQYPLSAFWTSKGWAPLSMIFGYDHGPKFCPNVLLERLTTWQADPLKFQWPASVVPLARCAIEGQKISVAWITWWIWISQDPKNFKKRC